MPTRIDAGWSRVAGLMLLFAIGCGGPSDREIKNARAFEALLTAISLRDAREVEADARLIVERHESGELSDGNYQRIQTIIDKARAGDWVEAEKLAYAFRRPFGDDGAYFR